MPSPKGSLDLTRFGGALATLERAVKSCIEEHDSRPQSENSSQSSTWVPQSRTSDDVWADFRELAGYRSISEVLGELVGKEVDRYRSRRVNDSKLEPRELTDALDRARTQEDDLAAIVERLEALRGLDAER